MVTTLLLSVNLYADDEDEFLSDEAIEVVKLDTKKDNKFVSYGSIMASSNYNYKDKNSITSAKLSTKLKFEYIVDEFHKIKSTIKAYKDYKTNTKDDKEYSINELSVEGTFHNGIDGKFGRQIVVWGKSDNIRITDVLNPLDNTAPAMVDIEDLRLGRFMTKLDYYVNDWSYGVILLHENRYSLMPKYGSDYYIPLNIANAPSNSIDNTGVALSASGMFQGQDLAFYFTRQYVDNTTYKSNMMGVAYNKVINSFLFKTEIAHFDNYGSNIIKQKTDGLVGLEYTGISDGSVSLEVVNKDDDIQYALRFTQSFMNQILDFTTLYSGFGKDLEDGGFVRAWFDYDLDDEIALSFGVVDYIGGDNIMFDMLKDNDRVFGSFKYSF